VSSTGQSEVLCRCHFSWQCSGAFRHQYNGEVSIADTPTGFADDPTLVGRFPFSYTHPLTLSGRYGLFRPGHRRKPDSFTGYVYQESPMRSFWLSRDARCPARSTSRTRAGRLHLESLEDRLAPATLTVNSIADTANATDPYLSLREAVALFNSPSLPSGLSDEILEQISGDLHGDGSDTIVFDPDAVSGPIVLGGTQLELSLPSSTASLTIDGGTGGTTVNGNHTSRVLMVDAGVQAALDHLTLTHGWTTTGPLYGGGIDNRGTLTVSDSVITANSAGFNGGGINNQGRMTVSNSLITSNSATVQRSGAGGGILNGAGMLTLSNSTISSNYSSEDGGGIDDATSTLTVSNCTLSSNSAAIVGGGGINNDRGTTTVNNCTLTANSASSGGGVFNFSATLTLNHATLTANQAGYGGGISQQFVTLLTLQSTIVAGNSSDILGGTANPSSTYNLIGTGGSGGLVNGANHDQVGVANPGLAPLGYYGGPTQTMPLLPGSPALAAGDITVLPGLDQRGQPRVVGGPSDIGAFLSQANPFLVTTLNDPGRQSGQLSLREAVNLANDLPGNATVSFDPGIDGGAVSLTSGQLELSGTGGVETIDGGNRFTVQGSSSTRLFQIDAATQAVVSGFDLGGGLASNGGAVLNQGTVTVANCTLWGNFADNGGAIYNQGMMTLYGSTLEFGVARLGAGRYNAGVLIAYNSTFVYNSAITAGGGIYNAAGATATLTSLTISLNSADEGGGLDAEGGTVLRNSIVAGNYNAFDSGPSDITGTVSSTSSYNLIGTGGSGGLVNGMNHDLVGVADPGLTTPVFIRPQTPVFGFTADSPALGAGDASLLNDPVLSLDQHENVRSVVNIGAI
jgi:hypothetical protein